jgi:hypothetical protein
MNTSITAYAEFAELVRQGATDYQVIDAAQSVGKKYPHVIGHVNVIRGFAYFTGDRYSAANGVEAIIAPSYPMEDGGKMTGDLIGAVQYALKHGLKSGRDDRS